ncbi:hypothetical protein LCGC14_2305080, partial [marine sediment metagenome]
MRKSLVFIIVLSFLFFPSCFLVDDSSVDTNNTETPTIPEPTLDPDPY